MSAPSLIERFNLRLPIVQAPMAGGATTPELVAQVCQAGALGFLGAGLLSPEQIVLQADEIMAKTNKAFGINLFVLSEEQSNNVKGDLPAWLAETYWQRGLALPTPERAAPVFEQQFDALLAAAPAVASFAFGIISPEHMRELKKRNIAVVGTVNHAEEARQWADLGADAVVVQGGEAGGHRGGFTEQYVEQPMGLRPLLTQCKQSVRIPLWAAGGLMTGQAVVAVQNMGAEAAQMGTAFLTTHESGIHPAYKNVLLDRQRGITIHTKLWSGRLARGVMNRFLRENMANEHDTLPYPLHNAFTQPLRQQAATEGNVEYMALWAGRGVTLCRDLSVADLIDALETEYMQALNR